MVGPARAENDAGRYPSRFEPKTPPPEAASPDAAAPEPAQQAEPAQTEPAPAEAEAAPARLRPLAFPPAPPRRPRSFPVVAPGPGEKEPPLTIRTYSPSGEALSGALTLREMTRPRPRAAQRVFAVPTSVNDLPAPALPSDKRTVHDLSGDEDGGRTMAPESVTPKGFDMATTGEEADYLVKQTEKVVTNCFPDDLRTVLARMAAHFGSPVIVTSGYRSRGKRHSLHRVCKAADIQIKGVRPSQIVAYSQRQPEIGGIGTYGYTRSVHVDVREQKISWRGNRGRGWFRPGADIATAAASGPEVAAAPSAGEGRSAGGVSARNR